MPVASRERPVAGPRPVIRAAPARRWDTPLKLRMLVLLVVGVTVVATAIAAASAHSRARSIGEIEDQIGPLAVDAVEVYRSLADADAAATTEFLSSGSDAAAARDRYDANVARAADHLARASARTGEQLAADRVADITTHLPSYTALVERSRANAERGADTVAAADLRRASELMQSTILRRAEALQRREALRLDAAFGRVGDRSRAALGGALATLAVVVAAQVFLSRTTRRMVNVGLLIATLAVVGAAGWSVAATVRSGGSLEDARPHSRMLTGGLGPAQIAASQASASEMLGLFGGDQSSDDEEFTARAQRLARDGGAGGALGAARRFASGAVSEQRVEEAVEKAGRWFARHGDVRALYDGRRHSEAVALAIDDDDEGGAAAFDDLDATLAGAVTAERAAFVTEVAASRAALGALVPATVVLGGLAAGAAARGIRQRLEEYV